MRIVIIDLIENRELTGILNYLNNHLQTEANGENVICDIQEFAFLFL